MRKSTADATSKTTSAKDKRIVCIVFFEVWTFIILYCAKHEKALAFFALHDFVQLLALVGFDDYYIGIVISRLSIQLGLEYRECVKHWGQRGSMFHEDSFA